MYRRYARSDGERGSEAAWSPSLQKASAPCALFFPSELRRLSLEWCYTAAGRFDLYLHGGQKLWDYAAGSLILEEAGGHMCGFDQDDFWAEPLWQRSAIAALDPGPEIILIKTAHMSPGLLQNKAACGVIPQFLSTVQVQVKPAGSGVTPFQRAGAVIPIGRKRA